MKKFFLSLFLLLSYLSVGNAQVAGWFTNSESASGNSEPATFYNQLLIGYGVDPWRIRILSDDPTVTATYGSTGDIAVYTPSGIYVKDDVGTSTNWSLVQTGADIISVTSTGIAFGSPSGVLDTKESNLAFSPDTNEMTLSGSFNHVGDISRTGLTELTGGLIQIGDATRTGSTYLTGEMSQTGNVFISGNTESTGFMTLTGGFHNVGTATHTGDLHVLGNVYATIPTTVTSTGVAFGNTSNALDTKESVFSFDNTTDVLSLTGGFEVAGAITQTGEFSSTGKLSGNRIGLELLSAEPATPVGEMVLFAMDGDNNSIFSKYPDGTVTDYSIATTPTSAFCVVAHVENTNVAGDNLADDVWEARTLNTLDAATDCTFLGLSNDQITITQTGNYRWRCLVPILNAGQGKTRLMDVSASGSVRGQGSNINTVSSNSGHSFLMTEVTVTGAFSPIIELQSYVTAGGGSGQGGSAMNLAGYAEKYQHCIIEKVQ